MKAELVGHIVPALDKLIDVYKANFNDYIAQVLTIFKALFACYYILMALIFYFIWRPYLLSLSTKLWRTKGILSMIPTEILKKYESLRNAFNANDIMKAVR